MPIHKGDGTVVVPTGFREVRLGDGTVLYSDGSGPTTQTQIESGIHTATNDHRTTQSLATYAYREDVADVARAHSQNMYEQQNLSHTLDGDDAGARLTNAGISWSSVAENIAWNSWGQTVDDTQVDAVVDDIMQGWLGSSGHLANIEGAYDAEGVGVYIDHATDEVWTTAVYLTP